MGYQLCTTLSPEIKSQQKLPFFLLLFSPQLRPSAWTEWTVLACHRSLPLKLPLSILRDDFTDRAVISKNLWMHASSFHGKRYRVVLHATFSWLFLFLLVFLFVLFLFFDFHSSHWTYKNRLGAGEGWAWRIASDTSNIHISQSKQHLPKKSILAVPAQNQSKAFEEINLIFWWI